ncbi:putative ABC-type xenobiotic transporter [Tanacetum coccineum]
MFFSGLCVFLRTIAVVASPLLFYAFVKYTNSDIKDLNQGLMLVACLIVVKVVESLSHRQFFFNARRTGMRMRSALMVAVYEKQLKLSSLGRKRHSAGEVVNYIAVDSYRMGEFVMWFHVAWSAVVQLFLAIGVLFSVVGLGVVPGLVPLFICGVLNIPFAKETQKSQLQFMVAQDRRLRSTSEILNNMKVIKLQCWEEKFKKIVESFRENELHWLREVQFMKAYGTILYWMSPTLVSSVILFGCVFLSSVPLDAATIFTTLATLRTMSEPVRWFPDALSALIQVKVSLDRINSFLVDDELKDNYYLVKSDQEQNSNTCIMVKDGNFAWDPESLTPSLQNVNLQIKRGQKVALCGSVGAGKSSMLYAILGEITKISKYEKTIKACALAKDIEASKHGDLTEIGQRGLNMSGGQKQRIQLAQAVYDDADIYLLDDPFSAVDAHTASTLFNDCVMTCLEEKTVILVTHQIEFLSSVDNILVMKGGQVEQSGHYKDLLMAGTALEQLVNAHKDAITCLDSSVHKTVNMHQRQEDANKINLGKENNETKGITGMLLTEDEEKEIGSVGWKSFWDYIIISEGSVFFYLCLLTHASFVALRAGATYWLAFVLGLKASKSFFNNFTNSVFNAPMAFFDSTPVGRILTRASSDLNGIDFDIPFSFAFMIGGGIELLVTIGVMASVTWQVLIVVILATLAIKYAHGYYEPTARELMRINGTTKAPVMNYASETSLGVATIRAFNMQERFFKDYLKLVDTDASTFIFSNATLEWYVYMSIVHTVERIKQFMNTPPEPPKIIKNNRPSSSWPSKGRIDFEDLKLRYRSNAPLVLNGLKDLRKKLSVIPQEPTLFKGSIRTNLDPLGLHSDDEIWKALEKCQLKSIITSLPNMPDSSVFRRSPEFAPSDRHDFWTKASLHIKEGFDRWDLDFEAWKFCFLPGQIASCLVIFFLSCSLFVAIYLDIDSKIMMIVVCL